MAEKASKFKVDTESRNKVNMSQYRYHKSNRDKRPSMVGEYYTTRMRGSHGNIQYGGNRNTFGSNRAISLDQYGSNSRRLSDGIQTVTSDSSVYYNHHQAQPPTHQPLKQNSADVLLEANNSNTALSKSNSGPEEQQNNTNTTNDQNRVHYLNNNNNMITKSGKGKTQTSNNSTSTASTKSLLTRLRNLTGRLSFSFDKDSRRLSNNSISHTIPLKSGGTTVFSQQVVTVAPPSPAQQNRKNNNTNNFSNLNPAGLDLTKKMSQELEKSARGRAFSLDVPPTKYNFSSGGSSNDGSRKSLASTRNDESLGEDTNSNNTENSVFIVRKRSSGVDTIDGVDI